VKRFWRDAAAVAEPSGFGVALDGRAARTPARHKLVAPSLALAEAIAGEWRAQGDEVDPRAMPLTRLTTTAIDLMPVRRDDAIAEVAGFAGTDLLCYRAAEPADLVARQSRGWQPWLDWLLRRHDSLLVTTQTVAAVAQPEASLRTLRAVIERCDDWRLVGLHAATTLTGSIVLGLALEEGAIEPEAAFALACLDELYEVERWGEEEEQQRRHAALRRDLAAADRFLRLLRS
jgi:chaperone required for assembly of F1-ATPase